jgi:hypothetical protein
MANISLITGNELFDSGVPISGVTNSSNTLQSVTDNGNYTTQTIAMNGGDLNMNGGNIVIDSSIGSGIAFISPDGVKWISPGYPLDQNTTSTLPLIDGVLCATVNGTAANENGDIAIAIPDSTTFVPYYGATSDIDLDIYSFNNSGGVYTNELFANTITKNGGQNTQFLKADGSVDNNVYLTSADLPSTLELFATTYASGINGYSTLVRNINDNRFDTTAVNVSTGAITTTSQFISGLISDANIIAGNPGIFDITTIGNIRRTSGSGEANFFFRIYKRDSGGTETLITQSNNTIPVIDGNIYVEFSAVALWNDGIFSPTDRVVIKYYANRISGGSNPTYQFQFGGITPIRSYAAIPVAVIPNIFLKDLADVENVAPLNNEALYWNSTAQLWEHNSISDILGYTPQKSITLTTTGSTGAATITTGGTLNIPQYGGTASQWTTTGTSIYYNIGNVLIGKTSDAAYKLDVLGSSNHNGQAIFQGQSTDSGQLSADLLTTGSGTNWAGTSYALGYTHTVGSVVALTSTFQPVISSFYQVILTVSNRTAGFLSITLGSTSVASSIFSNITTTYYIKTTSTNALITTPTTDFDGKVIISVKLVSVGTPSIIFNNSTPTVISEMRNSIATNQFFGKDSGSKFISGSNNYSYGNGALQNLINGDNSIAIGNLALNSSIVGITNMAIGNQSLQNNTSGFINIGIGQLALNSNTSGYQNTALGYTAGRNNTNGYLNIFIGDSAGNLTINSAAVTTISQSVIIGGSAKVATTASDSNTIVIGSSAQGLGSNTTMLGNNNTSNVTLAGNATIGQGQSNISGLTANCAVLDLRSTNRGLLLPRMTTAQVNAVLTPLVAGVTVYNTDLATICFYNGSSWQKVTSTAM